MAITKDNFIVVYELGNLDSAEFAAYYAEKHDMKTVTTNPSVSSGTTGGISWEVNGQLLGIQLTDNSEILSSELVFNTQLLNPIKDAIASAGELIDMDIWGIVLGYKIPGGFYDGDDIISSTSRISRLNFSFSKKTQNKLYNRSIFQRFNATDSNFALICSRMDGPDLQSVKTYVDNASNINYKAEVNGTFYIDPYSDNHDAGSDGYQELILDFNDNLLPSLNLNSWSTTFMDPYIDPSIPYVKSDSFVWSWFTDRATTSFFQTNDAIRVFFYNADYDGGYEVRNSLGKRWPFLAMNANYLSTAGAMSNPTVEGFLNPNAFFNALLRGATIGEAFLFSTPFLDWTISLFGDPLSICSFQSVEVVDEDVINEHEVWNIMSKDLAKSAANLYKKEKELREVLNNITDIVSQDHYSDIVLTILNPANDLYLNNGEEEWSSQLKPLVEYLFEFPNRRYKNFGDTTLSPNINEYLSDHNFKVSRLLTSVSGKAIIEDDNLLDEGWWQFEFLLQEEVASFANYHFKLEVFNNRDFSNPSGSNNILISNDSISTTNWTYEKEKDVFTPVTSNGVASSYIGRRVRYESRIDNLLGVNEYLTRGETYYFRLRQYNIDTLEEYSPREYSNIIYS